MQQVPALVFIERQAGDAGLHAPLAGAEEIAAVAVVSGRNAAALHVPRSSAKVLPNQMPVPKFWFSSMASE